VEIDNLEKKSTQHGEKREIRNIFGNRIISEGAVLVNVGRGRRTIGGGGEIHQNKKKEKKKKRKKNGNAKQGTER